MVHPTVILCSGIPGSGKTTLAREVARRLRVPLFSKDRLQSALRTHELAERSTADGYYLMFDMADEQLSLHLSVILDAVFPRIEFRDVVRDIAARHEAHFRPIYCYCSDEAVWRERMKDRRRYVPNWTPVGWKEVERLRTYYEGWDEKETLFVDSLQEVDQNVNRVVHWLGSAPAADPHL